MIDAKKLVVWDIDDTIWHLFLREFKNYSLLLPLLLYVTNTPSLKLAVCTNRRTRDEKPQEDDLSLNEILQMMQGFGIFIQNDCIITYNDVSGGLLSLQQDFSRNSSEPPLLIQGKNFQLNRLHNLANQGFNTLLEKNKIIFIDDSTPIIEAAQASGYSGIKATIPFDEDGQVPSTSVDYLFVLAEQIGLSAYIDSLLLSPEQHAEDIPLRKLAAILFMRNANPTLDLESILPRLFEKGDITPSIQSTLDAIQCYAHERAHPRFEENETRAISCFEKEREQNVNILAQTRREQAPFILQSLILQLRPYSTKTPRSASAPMNWRASSVSRTNNHRISIAPTRRSLQLPERLSSSCEADVDARGRDEMVEELNRLLDQLSQVHVNLTNSDNPTVVDLLETPKRFMIERVIEEDVDEAQKGSPAITVARETDPKKSLTWQ